MKKLVRDKIPQILGHKAEVVTGDNYRAYLSLKIDEEKNELRQASFFDLNARYPENVKEEAADVITAVLALCKTHGFTPEDVQKEIERKTAEKGGFDAGYVMEFS